MGDQAPLGRTVAGFENTHQVVEPTALRRRRSRGSSFDKFVDLQVVLAGILEDGEALALNVLAGSRNSEIGNGFHGSVDGRRFQPITRTSLQLPPSFWHSPTRGENRTGLLIT